ncbi:MAG: hypothetical protein Q9227_006917 [Pyrenula ochraceoflavens]
MPKRSYPSPNDADGKPSTYSHHPSSDYVYTETADRSSQELLQERVHVASLMRLPSQQATLSARATVQNDTPVRHEQNFSSTDQLAKGPYHNPYDSSYHDLTAQDELLRGIGDHVQTNSIAAQARHRPDDKASATKVSHARPQDPNLHQSRPMERFLRERPSDQASLIVDPVTGQLSYGGGLLRRLEERNSESANRRGN